MSRYFSTLNGPEYIRGSNLYERKPVTDLWSKLTVVANKQWKWKNLGEATREEEEFLLSDKRLVQVYGPPGIGKSSATFSWLDQVCSSLHTQALWIDCQSAEKACWLVDGTREQQGSRCSIEAKHAVPTSEEDASGCCAVVFDGVRKKMLENGPLAHLMFSIARIGVATLVVSSEGVRLPAGQSNDVAKLGHFVPSWTMEEYSAACNNDVFWRNTWHYFEGASASDNADRRTEIVGSKFEVAGHSARFMFHQTSFLVMEALRTATNAVDATSLEQATGQTASSGAVNTVVARLQADKNGITPVAAAIFPTADDFTAAGTGRGDFVPTVEESDTIEPQARIVSNYAAQQVTKNLPTDVRKLRILAQKLSNRVILGYAFEEQLQKSLTEAAHSTRSLRWRDETDGVDMLPIGGFMQWEKDEVEERLAGRIEDDTWVFVGGRQGLFDAIHVLSRTHIRFIQATVGKEHSFKLSILDSMMQGMFLNNAWHWTHVDFVMLRPTDEKDEQFVIRNPDGALQPTTLRFDGRPWARDASWRQNVSIRYLDWSE